MQRCLLFCGSQVRPSGGGNGSKGCGAGTPRLLVCGQLSYHALVRGHHGRRRGRIHPGRRWGRCIGETQGRDEVLVSQVCLVCGGQGTRPLADLEVAILEDAKNNLK